MDKHVNKLLSKFSPAFGLLRNLRGTLQAKTPRDIESGRPDLIQSRSQDDTIEATESAQQPQSTGSSRAGQEDFVDSSATNTNSGDDRIEKEVPPQPQFTDGGSRFVSAKEGSKDCVALLVNEDFLAKLRDLFQGNRDASALDGPLYHAKMDAKNIENSIQSAQESLEIAKNEREAAEYKVFIEQQTSELLKIRRRRDELEKEEGLVKGNVELSRSHTQWVLETAMTEANLLGPERPLQAILIKDR